MLIFNTTFHADSDIVDVYQMFMQQIYIPQAISGGYLSDPRFASIQPQHEQSGVSYSLQFRVKDADSLNTWMSGEGRVLQQNLVSKFGNKVSGFITLMNEIEL